MELEELKKQSWFKVLLRGKSSRGKTMTACKIAMLVSRSGRDVKYVDTEAEGSSTMLHLIEDEDADFGEEDIAGIEYVGVDTFTELRKAVDTSEQKRFDLVVVDTLDHKHTYALRHIVSGAKGKDEEKAQAEADWNEYLATYDLEKVIMEELNKPRANIVATLDPDSGKMDKPKGCQTNVHGYFSAVIDMKKSGEDWTNTVRNWIGNPKGVIGKPLGNPSQSISKEIIDRSG